MHTVVPHLRSLARPVMGPSGDRNYQALVHLTGRNCIIIGQRSIIILEERPDLAQTWRCLASQPDQAFAIASSVLPRVSPRRSFVRHSSDSHVQDNTASDLALVKLLEAAIDIFKLVELVLQFGLFISKSTGFDIWIDRPTRPLA
jgi:hypothetical protein